MEPTPSALEQFRQQWQQEVKARAQVKTSTPPRTRRDSNVDKELRSKPDRPVKKPATRHPLADVPDEEPTSSTSKHDSVIKQVEKLSIEDVDADEFSKLGRDEPKSALEHYERAVEKEGQGSLGESLFHYQQASRLDAKVDQIYKDKYFSERWKQPNTKPSNTSTTISSTTTTTTQHQPPSQSKDPPTLLTTQELVSRWSDEEIQSAPPMIEGDVPPPCPIRDLPTEVLLELLRHIALTDISIYTRLASACRKLAHHVYTETKIWRRVALGPEFGLASQKYHFSTDVQGRPITWQALGESEEDERPLPNLTINHFPSDVNWRETFQSHPRIRYTGVYISTVNYLRAGGTSVTPATWSNQVHIVTYYRYLRFFRDGTLISLLTTHEPIEVIHLLTKENITQVRSTGGKHASHPMATGFTTSIAPSSTEAKDGPTPATKNILRSALRGRWRLCHPSLDNIEIGSNTALPGDLHIETEGGAGPRYMYTMHLSLKNGNTRNKWATKNNKLVWKGFWSYNSLTDDWAEFHLRNDKAFWFSRVKSYGLGR